MAFNNNGRNGPVASMPPVNPGQGSTPPGWKELAAQRAAMSPKGKGRRGIVTAVTVILLIMVVLAGIRVYAAVSSTDDQFQVHLGDAATTVDLRQSFLINQNLFGVNVFPKKNSISVDKAANGNDNYSGFMNYTPLVINDLKGMKINLMRYPGGDWGEQHVLSYNQLDDFSAILNQTGAQGMIQVRLGPIMTQRTGDQKKYTDLAFRASQAGQWVDYMDNCKSRQRIGVSPTPACHPVTLWAVGNEPNLLTNTATNAKYTVQDYVNEFIQYSIAMHKNNPTIQVFGPEISSFQGIGAGPRDANGQLWMDDFLKGVANYEKQNPGLKFHLLDGVSFHRYPYDTSPGPALLLSSTNEWNYLLPQLRETIKQDFGRSIPVAITEINTDPGIPTAKPPTPGQAALWWADTLGTLMNQQVEYAAFFSAEGVPNPYPLFSNAGQKETAMARVMQLFAHLQKNVVPVAVQHDPVDMFATVDDARQKVSLLFVNKSAGQESIQINPSSGAPLVGPWKALNASVPPYSIAVINLNRYGSSDAYSFTVPTSNDATNLTVNPLAYAVCGQNKDPQAVC
jgi:hypothetical protein